MKAKLEAEIKAGEKVFIGIDYANGRDKAGEIPFVRGQVIIDIGGE